MMTKLELLAPAKNLECGIAAVDHGADAIYIGAPRFGARVAASNSVDDIRQLCDYAHRYAVKVFVTVNTLLHADELTEAERLIWQLYEAGVDAILVQDMQVLRMNLPPIALHASTQTDNRTPERVLALQQAGFRRVVLARELSVDEITAVHAAVPDMPLEVFVHGALCVSYSGVCYASEYCFGRSANRGACAQFCRMPFDLVDADGTVIEHQRHLLSLKDLNQSDHLQELIDAGATSFKIEGRLKDVAYVKNVTAAYSRLLDAIVRRHPDRYSRASLGRCSYTFTPNLHKTFNRGYTTYFLHGRQPDIACFDTPKAMGEYVGTVKELRGNSFTVAGTASFANGDGLCFITPSPSTFHTSPSTLTGFRVNRAEGNRLYPLEMPAALHPGIRLYRNNDIEFERLLSRPSAERKIPITFRLETTETGYRLTGRISGQLPTPIYQQQENSLLFTLHSSFIDCPHQQAAKPQRDNIVRQLSRLGGTPYECVGVEFSDDFNDFIPNSLLADLRQKWVEQQQHPHSEKEESGYQSRSDESATRQQQDGDLQSLEESPLMQCRHCLRYTLGHCVRRGGTPAPWREPLALRLADGRRFPLEFDCRTCQMNVWADTSCSK